MPDIPGPPVSPAPEPPSGASWQAQRREAASLHAEALSRRRSGEAARARELIAEFVQEARRRGVEPVRLRARSYDGQFRYRTATYGWYLRRNQSVAVGRDGQFYLLTVPASLRSLVRGAVLEASDPPLVLGKGARDGESIDLTDALQIALGDPPPPRT